MTASKFIIVNLQFQMNSSLLGSKVVLANFNGCYVVRYRYIKTKTLFFIAVDARSTIA